MRGSPFLVARSTSAANSPAAGVEVEGGIEIELADQSVADRQDHHRQQLRVEVPEYAVGLSLLENGREAGLVGAGETRAGRGRS